MKVEIKNPIISSVTVGWPNPPVTTITFENEAERKKFMKNFLKPAAQTPLTDNKKR